MIAVQATYDGKEFKPLPSEKLPEVSGEISVTIVFPEDLVQAEKRKRLLESAQRMRSLRDAMAPLGMTVAELLEESRSER
jgi:hypothetical protein